MNEINIKVILFIIYSIKTKVFYIIKKEKEDLLL
jgi:hypothetical protein